MNWDDDDKGIANLALEKAAIVRKLSKALDDCEREARERIKGTWSGWEEPEGCEKTSTTTGRLGLRAVAPDEDGITREVFVYIDFGHGHGGRWQVQFQLSVNTAGNPNGLITNYDDIVKAAREDIAKAADGVRPTEIRRLEWEQHGGSTSAAVASVPLEIAKVDELAGIETTASAVFDILPVILGAYRRVALARLEKRKKRTQPTIPAAG